MASIQFKGYDQIKLQTCIFFFLASLSQFSGLLTSLLVFLAEREIDFYVLFFLEGGLWRRGMEEALPALNVTNNTM